MIILNKEKSLPAATGKQGRKLYARKDGSLI